MTSIAQQGGSALPVYLSNGTQVGGSAQPVILVGPDGVPLVSVTVSPFMQSILDDADASAVQASLGLSADSIASIPEAPVMRGSDAAIGAGQGTGQLIAIRQQIKLRRARLRIGNQSGLLSVAAYDTALARLVTSGAVQCGPVGAMEVALPPTTLEAGRGSLWMATDNGTATFGVNSTYGDVTDGLKLTSGAQPLPQSITGAVPGVQLSCLALLADDPVPLSASRAYSRTDIGISVLGLSVSRLYGVNLTSGHWVYSDDGTTWTDTGQSPSVNPGSSLIVQLVFHSTFQIAVTSDGKLYRNTKDVWTAWTDISVPGLPVGTTGRVDVLASNGTNLYYGNYNNTTPGGAKIYRSTNNGGVWAEVLDAPTARHVHAILVDPNNSAKSYATLGDTSQAGNGLYYSGDSGATWARISSNRYGIGIVIPTAVTSVPTRIFLGGDGAAQPHMMTLFYGLASAGTSSQTDALIWYDADPDDGASWIGTTRGPAMTTEGNLVYFSTGESGAVGTRDGLWIARGPWCTTPVLLEELTGHVPVAYQKTFIYGSSGVMFNYRYKYVLPKFAGQ